MDWRAIFTFKRFVYYGFPLYLIVVEQVLLSLLAPHSEHPGIAASTSPVAAAGLSLIAPVLIPKPAMLDEATLALLKANGMEARGKRDQRLVYTAIVALLLLPFLWGKAIALNQPGVKPLLLHMPAALLLALAIYAIGIIFTEVKEAV